MKTKLEKIFRQEINKSQKTIFKEMKVQLEELKEAKRDDKNAPSEDSQNEFNLEHVKQSLSRNKPTHNPNQNLSINIQVGNSPPQAHE